MLSVKAIPKEGGEDIYHCNRVQYCGNAVILDSYAAETATGNSYSQMLWFVQVTKGVEGWENVYKDVYVSHGGKTIAHYNLSPSYEPGSSEVEKAPDTAKAA